MNLIKIILVSVLGYLIYRVLKPYFIGNQENPYVKGENKDKNNIQKRHSKNIEDADFEDVNE